MSDTCDIVSLAEAKEELGITANTYDERLSSLITAVSRRLDGLCGPVVQREVTELHNGGCYEVFLNARPVASVTSVTEYCGTTAQVLAAESNSAKTANDYMLDDDRKGILRRRSNGYDTPFAYGRRNVSVVVSAGRAATTAAVDDRFKQAARICLKHLWRAENTIGTATFGPSSPLEPYIPGVPTFAIPRAALELIADELIGRGSEVLLG